MSQKFAAKYFLNDLQLKKGGNSVDRISATLLNAKIKLTPHQIDASLFAFKSPIDKGVILADEVGLGKTIEAGIVIAQLWFERHAKILIISPAPLMRQWYNELYDKFSLKSEIMDRRLYNSYQNKGYSNPFEKTNEIIICSYQFASMNYEDISNAKFDTVIIDEAHKLRNVYNEKNIMSNNIKKATENYKKILLTATPIQNSLMDIYGLASFIDDNIFGDKNVFKYNYIRNFDENSSELQDRISTFLHRTLRNQVSQYIKFTNRIAKTFTFSQSNVEKEIYDELRNIINNPEGSPYIIPNKQKHLLLLILSKLMGSSVYALRGTLEAILKRLIAMQDCENYIEEDYTLDDELIEGLDIDTDCTNESENQKSESNIIDTVELQVEICKINNLIDKIDHIEKESKYYTLLDALKYSFEHLEEKGENKKVIIFTESRRTQEFLYNNLTKDGYDKVLMFNGSNSDNKSNSIYNEWINRPENLDKRSNAKSLNMRSAIIDEFEHNSDILIATEAGAEGLNLQFCSLIINYDLPWNPQRVEQRIGRSHRFGQKYDVTVINFINKSNLVEQRIYELLSTKFHLFNDIFGASDEILGKIDNAGDLQESIAEIYMNCRSSEEINESFNNLQKKYDKSISETISKTKKSIVDNFEEDIQGYFEDTMISTEANLNNVELSFWNLAKCVLNEKATFDDSEYILNVHSLETLNGEYKISSRNSDNKYMDFNTSSKLGEYVINNAVEISEMEGKTIFNVSEYPYNLKQVENLKSRHGLISLHKIIIDSFELEEHLILNGILDDGSRIQEDTIKKMFRVKSKDIERFSLNPTLKSEIDKDASTYANKIINESSIKNNTYLSDGIKKINSWADDKIQSVEMNVELMREQRKELRKKSDLCTNFKEKELIEEEISKLTGKITKCWMNLAENEEKVEEKRKLMVDSIKKENMKTTSVQTIFTIEFEVI